MIIPQVLFNSPGITQEMIDDTRAISEKQMLADLKYLLEEGGDIEYRDHQGATPVRYFLYYRSSKILL